MIDHYRIVLDSGALGFHSFTRREDAHAEVKRHNAKAKEGKDRGDMVTLRYAVGVVCIKPKPVEMRQALRRKRKVA